MKFTFKCIYLQIFLMFIMWIKCLAWICDQGCRYKLELGPKIRWILLQSSRLSSLYTKSASRLKFSDFELDNHLENSNLGHDQLQMHQAVSMNFWEYIKDSDWASLHLKLCFGLELYLICSEVLRIFNVATKVQI